MTATEEEIKALVTIGNWAKSCKTIEQLNNVEVFLNNRVKTTRGFMPRDIVILNYNLGMVNGIILSLKKLRFKK